MPDYRIKLVAEINTENPSSSTNDCKLISAVATSLRHEGLINFYLDDPSHEQKRMLEGRDIALIHNHPNNSPASNADLSAALDLGVLFLVLVTPAGLQYHYRRYGDEMKLVEVIHNPDYVALPSAGEDEESRAAYEAQMLAILAPPFKRNWAPSARYLRTCLLRKYLIPWMRIFTQPHTVMRKRLVSNLLMAPRMSL